MKSLLTMRERVFLKNILDKEICEIFLEDIQINSSLLVQFLELRKKINSDYPLDYLIGKVKLKECDLELVVSEDVLIPRHETIEWLVESINQEWIHPSDLVIDIGTGSGLIALFYNKNGYTSIGTDCSKDALDIALINGKLNPPTTVQWFESDLLLSSELQECIYRSGSYSIVANLPYLPIQDKNIEYSSIQYEPDIALYSGKDGLDSARRLLTQISQLSLPPTTIILELDPRNIRILAEENKHYTQVIHKDSGDFERVLRLI